jgi:hypothetical protein
MSANWMRAFGRFNVGDAGDTADEALAEMQGQLLRTQTELEEERRDRIEAQQIADDLYGEVDATLAELEACQEEVSSLKGVAEE